MNKISKIYNKVNLQKIIFIIDKRGIDKKKTN